MNFLPSTVFSFWQIPVGNDAIVMCGLDTVGDGDSDSLLVVRNVSGDYRVYLWNMPASGDWSYAQALARNPSAFARDFWMLPAGNDIELVVGVGRGGVPDELAVMKLMWGSDQNLSFLKLLALNLQPYTELNRTS